MNEPAIIIGHQSDGLILGDVELRLYQSGNGWRIATTVEPADPQYNDFASRQEAVAFLKHAIEELMAKL